MIVTEQYNYVQIICIVNSFFKICNLSKSYFCIYTVYMEYNSGTVYFKTMYEISLPTEHFGHSFLIFFKRNSVFLLTRIALNFRFSLVRLKICTSLVYSFQLSLITHFQCSVGFFHVSAHPYLQSFQYSFVQMSDCQLHIIPYSISNFTRSWFFADRSTEKSIIIIL